MPNEQEKLSYKFLDIYKYDDPIKVLIECIYRTSITTDRHLLYDFFHTTMMDLIRTDDYEEAHVQEFVHFTLRIGCMIEAAHTLCDLKGLKHFTYSYPGTDILDEG